MDQGCQRLFSTEAVGANRANGAFFHVPFFFLLILAQLKHQKFGALLRPLAKGGRGSR